MIHNESNIYFYESSNFWNTWLKYISMPFILIPILITFIDIYQGKTSVDNIIGLIVLNLIFIVTIVLILFIMKLELMITDMAIKFRFFPIHIKYKIINFNEILSYNIKKYKAISEYGGWGIRYNFKKGWAYIISGNVGIQIIKTDGKHILFSTNKIEEFFAILDNKIKSKNKEN